MDIVTSKTHFESHTSKCIKKQVVAFHFIISQNSINRIYFFGHASLPNKECDVDDCKWASTYYEMVLKVILGEIKLHLPIGRKLITFQYCTTFITQIP